MKANQIKKNKLDCFLNGFSHFHPGNGNCGIALNSFFELLNVFWINCVSPSHSISNAGSLESSASGDLESSILPFCSCDLKRTMASGLH